MTGDMSDTVVLHPDDVETLRSTTGEVLGYRVARRHVSKQPADAVHFTGGNIAEVWDWAGAADIYGPTEESRSAFITTPEGHRLEVKPGDWIVRNASGELWPCEPGIFEANL